MAEYNRAQVTSPLMSDDGFSTASDSVQSSPKLSGSPRIPSSPQMMSPPMGSTRMARPMGAGLSRTSSGYFSVDSGRRGHGQSMRSGSSFVLNTSAYTRPFKTRRNHGPVDKPWLNAKKTKSRWITGIIPLVGLAAGLAIVAVYGYTGWADYDTAKFCPVWTDDFSGGLDTNVWSRDVQIGGFGNGQFEYATEDDANSYVKDGMLYITPTVGAPWEEGASVNLTAEGRCTASGDLKDLDKNCYAIQNVTGGDYIPVVRSARLTTKMSKSMKYGKLEVRAKLPVGDWIWPAIWMMPKDSVYGAWPASGEIDIVESRGNGHEYFVYQGDPKNNKRFPAGNNAIGSTLHWGGDSGTNKFYKTTNGYHYPSAINGLTDAFHTYGMEWTPNGIRIYVDKQLTRVVYFKFPKQGFWSWGDFATNIVNPWFGGTKATPFDQEFYLILNVAIGGTNGYFADNVNEKPWTNGLTRGQALHSFQRANQTWLPTWKQPSLIIDSVKMWEICK